MRQNELMTRREDLLSAGAPESSRTARVQILAAARKRVEETLARAPQADAAFALTSAGGLTVVDATDRSSLAGAQIGLERVPAEARAQLAEGRSAAIDLACEDLTGSDPRRRLFARRTPSLLLIPLVVFDELAGLILVESPAPLAGDLRADLEAIAGLLAPALETVSLNESMQRRGGADRFRSIVQNSSDAVTLVDSETTIVYATPSVERVIGYAPAELVGIKLTELVHPEDVSRALAFFAEASSRPGATTAVEWRVQHRSGAWLHLETIGNNLFDDPAVGQLVLASRDISERKTLEDQLSHQAFHDPLTDLANRVLLRERVERALVRRRGEAEPCAVLFLDLDNFKNVNDSLGHVVGDALLVAVAGRLHSCLRPEDTAARLGGDEFAILLEDASTVASAVAVAERIIEALEAPFPLEGKQAFIGASVGIAVSCRGDGADELLRNADIAMYMAKGTGKGGYCVFEPSMHAAALERLELESDLRRALEQDEFVLHYQPIVAMKTGTILGVEALLRWHHPGRGLLLPSEFISLAEETGLIVGIGRWVLEKACMDVAGWQEEDRDDPPLRLSVNLSGRQLAHAALVEDVEAALKRSGLVPETLILEITESVMMPDNEAAVRRLNELKSLGLKLSVDDFGTGYSSLRYLHTFPVDVLKIAQEFVGGLWSDSHQGAFVRTIVELTRTLGLETIAVGVESSPQADELRKLGTELGQGYFLSRPREWSEMRALLREGRELSDYVADILGSRERLEADWWGRALGARPAQGGLQPA